MDKRDPRTRKGPANRIRFEIRLKFRVKSRKSKCRRINRVDFKRTDFDEFVTNVKNGYQCMSPEYRHFGTYSLATMSKFSRFLYLKPSIVKTLTHLSMNSVDWLNTEEDVTEVGFICHLIG